MRYGPSAFSLWNHWRSRSRRSRFLKSAAGESFKDSLPGAKGEKMKDPGSCPQERGCIGLTWLRGTAIALAIGILLLASHADSGARDNTRPIPGGQTAITPETPTKDPPSSREASRSDPTPGGGKALAAALKPTTYPVPKELPAKGSPKAKVTLVEYFEFH
jgi:hypothetical protein